MREDCVVAICLWMESGTQRKIALKQCCHDSVLLIPAPLASWSSSSFLKSNTTTARKCTKKYWKASVLTIKIMIRGGLSNEKELLSCIAFQQKHNIHLVFLFEICVVEDRYVRVSLATDMVQYCTIPYHTIPYHTIPCMQTISIIFCEGYTIKGAPTNDNPMQP